MRRPWPFLDVALVAGVAVLAGVVYRPGAADPRSRDGAGARAGGDGAAGPGLTLEGIVVDGTAPVAGATVLLTSDEDGDAFSSARCPNEEDRSILECPCAAVPDLATWRFADGRGEAEPILETTTDEEGAFLVAGLRPGRYAIWAEAGPLAAMVYGVEAGGSVHLELRPGVWYAGIVRDEEGNPIADALVAAVHTAHSRFFSAHTDDEGAFELGPLPEGRYAVLASAEGRTPVLDEAPSGDMDLELRAAARVEGTVVRDGAPVAGAEVRVQVACSPLVATTDADGRFVLDRLRPERATLAAFSGEDGGTVEVDLTEDDRVGVEIALRRGGTVVGEVRDDRGAPVGGVRVAIDGGAVETAAETDGDGTFRVAGLPPDDYAVWLFPPGGFVKPGKRVLQVQQGREVQASYRLLRAVRLTGVVQDEEGFAVAGAAVVARRAREGAPLPRDWDAQGEAEARSDATGAFTLEAAAAGPLRVSIEAGGFIPATLEARAPGELTATLQRGGALDVEVVDEAGAPVPGALLTATGVHAQGAEPLRLEAAADARGWYRFVGLPAGRYHVVAQLRPPAGILGRYVRTVAADETVEGRTTTALTLRFDAGLSIAGKVVEEASGRPVAGAEVWAIDELKDPPADGAGDSRRPGAGGFAVTDAEGRFEIEHLRAHRHALSWASDGYGAGSGVRVRPGGSGLVLTLRRTPRVTGRVLGDDGRALERFRVGSQRFTAPDGRFTAAFLHGGRETLRIEAEGFAPVLKDVVLDGRDVDLGDVRLTRGRSVRIGVVSATSSEPIASALVRIGAAGEEPFSLASEVAQARTGRDGTATFPGLPAAALDVVVSGAGLAPARVPLGAASTELTVRLGVGGRIEGTVRNASGEPIRNVQVIATSTSFSREAPTDEEGRFALEGLPPEQYNVGLPDEVGYGNAGLSPRLVKLAGGGTVRVDFRESAGATLTLTVPSPDDCDAFLVPGTLGPNADEIAEALPHSLVPVLLRDRFIVAYRGLPRGVYTAGCLAYPSAPGEPELVSLREIAVTGADLEVTLPRPATVVSDDGQQPGN